MQTTTLEVSDKLFNFSQFQQDVNYMDVGPFNRMFLEQQGDVAFRDNVLQEEDTLFPLL